MPRAANNPRYSDIEKKARRRIYRQIRTGVKQARVRVTPSDIYVYLVKHRKEKMTFRLGKNGKLRKEKVILMG